MNEPIRKDWRALSEAASREQDPDKLLELITELNQALEEHEKSVHPPQAPRQNTTSLSPASFVSSFVSL